MPKTKNYHRGDVKTELINAAVEALKTQSFQAVSMRKLASAIGVSHNAPYMHFKDKEALWLAISDHGFEMLSNEITREIATHSTWRDRLEAGCRAYVRFAERNREYMLVMFRPATPGNVRALSPKGAEALDLLTLELAAGGASGQIELTDPAKLAVLIWIMLHGLTMAKLQIGGERGPLLEIAGDDHIGWMLDKVLATEK
ncbi:TetR/AcrR family transcriptional regulator [uncultured Maritimibacter sp.]|jgi:AcrR family transcriptional regulator|uniref:TetR/AcrR family transcriptional regulator n=1 Tax=uncultured Maritimibacter sp. TaxID=991866 RepID=UPI00261FB03E|nr:TetR/AcrR family transcriptional regulator [uncultured Maritimibacter sp.]